MRYLRWTVRKMSLTTWKSSFIRRSSRQSNTRSNVCCDVDDANGETEDTSIKSPKTELTIRARDITNCQCNNHLPNDKQGIFKSFKKKFNLKPNITRPLKSKPHQGVKVRDCSNGSVTIPANDASSSDGFATANSRKCKALPFRLMRNSFDRGSAPRLSIYETEEQPQIKHSGESASRNSFVQFARRRFGVPKSYCSSIETSINHSDADSSVKRTRAEENPPNVITTDGVTHIIMRLDNEVQYESESCDIPASPNTRSLTCELFKLAQYGWYWGPITREEAEEKLLDLPDGSFLVRDSAADRYLLSVSFRSSGKTFHTRIEHSHGLFSLYSSPGQEGFSSIIELINHSMSFSESAVFCYSRPRAPGYPAFPVRLVKPVSRFTQVRSLQYLCRFVIRQYTRVDNIQKLPLPNRLKGYIQEGHY